MDGNFVGTSVRVPREVLDRLDRVSELMGTTKGKLHRQALEFYLTLLESGHFLTKWHRDDWERRSDVDLGPDPEEAP